MELTLHRKYRLPNYTIGKLYVNGQYYCDTLEDADRDLYQGMSKDWIEQKRSMEKPQFLMVVTE